MLTRGERLATRASEVIGSWGFLIIQALILLGWVVTNGLRLVGFDPPPFILLNLCLSFQAAFTGPILLIAANAVAARDRLHAAQMDALAQQNYEMATQVEALSREINIHVQALTERLEIIHRDSTQHRALQRLRSEAEHAD